MEIRFIFFDYGGTIDSNGVHWRKRFYNIYLENGINISYDDFSKAFFDSDDNLPYRHDLKGKGFEETIYLQVRDVFKYLKVDNEKKFQAITSRFIADTKKNIEINREVFKILKGKGIKLGIISNFYGNLENVLKSLKIRDYFDAVADSGVIGHIKPEKEIFLWALNKLNAKLKFSAMVGDSWYRDIKGAHNIGMWHFYLSNEEKNKCCKKLIRIKTLKEILNYI